MKTVEQIIADMHEGKNNRVIRFKNLVKTMLFNILDDDYDKIRPGTDYYSGKTQYYDNGAAMTYCNIFCYLFLRRLGLDIDCLLGDSWKSGKPSPYYTPINLFIEKCEKSEITKEVNYTQAQNLARQGLPVVICAAEKYNSKGALLDPGHMGIVYPEENIQTKEMDIMICNAGSSMVWGLKSMYDAFLRYGYKPRYFYISGIK